MHTHMHTCTHTYTHTYTHMHTHTHTCTHTCTHTYTHAHTYTHIHTHAHTYTHTYTIHTHCHLPEQQGESTCTHKPQPSTFEGMAVQNTAQKTERKNSQQCIVDLSHPPTLHSNTYTYTHIDAHIHIQ